MACCSVRPAATCGGQAKGVRTTGVSVVDTVTQTKSGVLGSGGIGKCTGLHHPWLSRGVFFGQERPSPQELYLVSLGGVFPVTHLQAYSFQPPHFRLTRLLSIDCPEK